ncbi:D-alanyl-D-alanine carboxypeptidase [Anaerosalibacter bizertensis]|uniref:serine-type D-Ala-D-Ala carboxypeptidase n=1 Tax=Anaerosalibacter bizertensis TaxID=932217 RepID=A0A844FHM2_9FIRM|nr:D-alanyl-D-alanine carboxypeptidase family protein [Anaerosalibacter bizertensis]MBV1819889.1 D-alanyl-D-alanine carboxypeptidase [Bacteroidales bacterium MSK.15.36]MCB5560494.1 D-alanyl-D-alanine carboxypeptidase [Anaerosalibacter bizertensis]MCG4564983.1 D-alanyl-D-alanine carboxypeptidase [Anaerosalibacter bizertensis]MCG4583136.1 D-alanyl-D-alanine carboxypeptidase [Anaerosalibacter bizertensis]MSS43442.1 D-alanyl-D-alanine carboxypeptidase [Anaerosalibacter bizertensis]
MKNIFKRQLFLVLILVLFTNSIAFAGKIGIEDGVSAYLLGDFEDGRIVEEYNIDTPLAIASITKLMTYTIVMDEIRNGNISMDDIITIDKEVEEVNGSTFELKEGEKFSVETLLESTLIVSANDSCVALAKHISGDVPSFVNKMNQKAEEIGLEHTRYLNPNGLPEKNGQNTMTVRDIFKLSRYIIKEYPEILEITKKDKIDIEDGIRDEEFVNENTNPLLKEMNGVDGLKTGFTGEAGYCLVFTTKVKGQAKSEDFRLIGIVMGTKSEESRKNISKYLLEYGISNYKKREVLSKNIPVDIIHIPNANRLEVEVFPKENIRLLEKNNDNILQKIVIDNDIQLPLKKGDTIGKTILYSENSEKVLKEVELILGKNVKEANFITKTFRNLKGFFKYIGINFFKI